MAVLLPNTRATLAAVSFRAGGLADHGVSSPTSLQFGPDDRLYVAQQNGLIKVFSLQRNGAADYSITASETISILQTIPNHNDNGALAPSVVSRQVTGILVTGTASSPVIFVASSDPRIKTNNQDPPALTHDTNSGVLSRLTWNGSSWEKLDLVRGLPRSEENHASNGLALDEATNTIYLMSGGNTNAGAPSAFFGSLPEYALSAALLAIDLDAIGESPYDLATLDDEDRPGTDDANDPFGGNDGKNQAIVDPGGPVQIYSAGWRNAYDVLLTANGRLYSVDNGANGGYGAAPLPDCSNTPVEGGDSYLDALHLIPGPGYYAGHPNPTRGSQSNTFNQSNPQSPVPQAQAAECDFLEPGTASGEIVRFGSSTNGITEYTASNFSGEMEGNLLVASYDGLILRVVLNAAGDALASSVTPLFSGFGEQPLDVTALGENDVFPGTVWTAVYGSDDIVVFEPDDYDGREIPDCEGVYDSGLDEDQDGFTNSDEIDNGVSPCNAGSVPPDHDKDRVSDLNDPDDDNDLLPDTVDFFALDPENGASTDLPVFLTWNNGEPPRGGILNLGFTGLMQNGSDYLTLFDPDKIIPGGAPGVCTVIEVPDGDALGEADSQLFGFQLGINVDQSTAPFVAQVRLIGPFSDVTAQDWMSMGLFFGVGDQDNYLRIAAVANGGDGGIEVGIEQEGVYAGSIFGPTEGIDIFSSDQITVSLAIDPQTTLATARTEINGAETVLTTLSFPAEWLQGSSRPAIGLISTARGAPTSFSATWDDLFAFDGTGAPDEILYRVNAGGPAIAASDGGPVWSEDTEASPSPWVNANAAGNTTYITPADVDISNSTVPAGTPMPLFQTERFDPPSSPEMKWTFPVPSGTYSVRLYFAENYLSDGSRFFAIKVEDQDLETGFSPFLESGGKHRGLARAFGATVLDGTLDVEFLHQLENPMVQGIEVLGAKPTGNPAPVLDDPGPLSSVVGDSISLQLVAADPEDEPITFGATGLPDGLSLDHQHGLVTGVLTTAGAFTVVATATDGFDTDTENFVWNVTVEKPPGLWQTRLSSDASAPTARHESAFVEADGLFYLLGGRGIRPTDVFDPLSGSWSAMAAPPIELHHFQAVELEGKIYAVGAFTGSYPDETAVPNVYLYDPNLDEWDVGDTIPASRRRGSAGVVVRDGKILVVGGIENGHRSGWVPWFDEYDPSSGQWTELPDAPRARDHFHAAIVGHRLILAGGRNTALPNPFVNTIPEIDVYDFTSGLWTTLEAGLPTERAGASVGVVGNELLVIGGESVWSSESRAETEVLDTLTGTWRSAADLVEGRHGTQAIVAQDRVWVAAGSGGRGGSPELSTLEVYLPAGLFYDGFETGALDPWSSVVNP